MDRITPVTATNSSTTRTTRKASSGRVVRDMEERAGASHLNTRLLLDVNLSRLREQTWITCRHGRLREALRAVPLITKPRERSVRLSDGEGEGDVLTRYRTKYML